MAQATNPYSTIVIGSLPPNNGITMTLSTGSPQTTFVNKGIPYELSIVCNGKHTDAQVVSDALNGIHQALTQTKNYPSTDLYQITDIETVSAPNYIGREENNQILYGSILRVKAYVFALSD